MFEIKNIRKVDLLEVDSLLNTFQNDTGDSYYLDQFFFEKSYDLSNQGCKNYETEGKGYSYFNSLINEFPFLSSNYTNGIILLKTPKNFLDEETLTFLLRKDSSWNFETKNLGNNFKVLIINHLPCVFLQQLDSENYQKIIIAYAHNTSPSGVHVSNLPLHYHPDDLLENTISAFSNYISFFFPQRFTEYLDIVEEGYQHV
jgi:hypothetical protein